MGNCNMDCCKSIDKRETQFIHIPNKSNTFNPQKFNQIKPIEFSQIIFTPKDNIENKNEENNNMIYRNEKNKNYKKYNENTNSDTNYKDITIKYSKKLIKDRFYNPNNRYDQNFVLLKSKTKDNKNNNDKNLNLNNLNNKKNKNDSNKKEDAVINERKSPIISPRYISTNFKLAQSNYSRYFEHIEECRKNLEMTDKGKNGQNNLSNNFPIIYNQKNKYITFFTEDDI